MRIKSQLSADPRPADPQGNMNEPEEPGGAVIKSLFVNNDFIWLKLPWLLNR